ncbi:hypothetical protein B0H13DRAFT_1855646 [Mycena leptocephala]|nr:hypothetical protein B0H13DRAFT_1855646 [Mycena leptocephala]
MGHKEVIHTRVLFDYKSPVSYCECSPDALVLLPFLRELLDLVKHQLGKLGCVACNRRSDPDGAPARTYSLRGEIHGCCGRQTERGAEISPFITCCRKHCLPKLAVKDRKLCALHSSDKLVADTGGAVSSEAHVRSRVKANRASYSYGHQHKIIEEHELQRTVSSEYQPVGLNTAPTQHFLSQPPSAYYFPMATYHIRRPRFSNCLGPQDFCTEEPRRGPKSSEMGTGSSTFGKVL